MKTFITTIAAICFATLSFPTVPETHKEAWGDFVSARCKIGAQQSEVDSVLLSHSQAQIIVDLGGTGDYVKYYAIDDFVQIAAEFDRKKTLVMPLRVIPRTKWRRYPDGRGWVDPVGGQTVDPKDGTLIVP